MNRWVVAGGAISAGALAVAIAAREPAKPGIPVPTVPTPDWYKNMVAITKVRWPGSTNVAGAATKHILELKRQWGTMTISGDELPKIPVGGISLAAGEWASIIVRSGATITDGGRRWVESTAPGYKFAAITASELTDPTIIRKFIRELAELASYLEQDDHFEVANPDTRTYWDFLYARAKDSTALKLSVWPVYGPYYVASKAWDAAPDVVTTVAKDILGPSAKFLVTTFGTVLFVGGVALYVYKKWPGGG